jgi:hypothetical protein
MSPIRAAAPIASSTGDDPELDELIVMLHIQTASDRQAAIDLALHDLDRDNCLVRLRTRGGGFHWHPVSPRLMTALSWSVYQRIIAAYSHPGRRRGKTMITTFIDPLRRGMPAALRRTGSTRAHPAPPRHDVLVYFDHHASKRTHRSHQRPTGSPPPQRPRIPEPHPLPNPISPTLRQPHRIDHCT